MEREGVDGTLLQEEERGKLAQKERWSWKIRKKKINKKKEKEDEKNKFLIGKYFLNIKNGDLHFIYTNRKKKVKW